MEEEVVVAAGKDAEPGTGGGAEAARRERRDSFSWRRVAAALSAAAVRAIPPGEAMEEGWRRREERGVPATRVAEAAPAWPGVPPPGAADSIAPLEVLPRRLPPATLWWLLPPPPLPTDMLRALMPTAALVRVGRLPTATV